MRSRDARARSRARNVSMESCASAQPRVERRGQDPAVKCTRSRNAMRAGSSPRKLCVSPSVTQAHQQAPAFADARRDRRVAPAQPRAARARPAAPGPSTMRTSASKRSSAPSRAGTRGRSHPRATRACRTPVARSDDAMPATCRQPGEPHASQQQRQPARPGALRAAESAACPPRRCLRHHNQAACGSRVEARPSKTPRQQCERAGHVACRC